METLINDIKRVVPDYSSIETLSDWSTKENTTSERLIYIVELITKIKAQNDALTSAASIV